MSHEGSPWMCHVCDYRSTVGEGLVCSECYKITCTEHMTTTTRYDEASGLYQLVQVCVACQFSKRLHS